MHQSRQRPGRTLLRATRDSEAKPILTDLRAANRPLPHSVTLYAFFGYWLLVFAGVLALRVLVLVFRSDTG